MAMPNLQWYPWNLNLIKNVEATSFFWLKKCLFLWVFPLLQNNQKNRIWKKSHTLISDSYLNRQSFQEHRFKSCFAIFAWRVNLNYTYSTFKWILILWFWCQRNWVFVTNSNFLITIFQPDGVNIWYCRLRLFDLTELKVIILKVYDIGLQRFIVCGKTPIHLLQFEPRLFNKFVYSSRSPMYGKHCILSIDR